MSQLEQYKGIDSKIVEQFQGIVKQIIDITVDDTTIYLAVDFTKRLGTLGKIVDAERKKIIQPIKDNLAEVEKPFKLLSTEIANLDTKLRKHTSVSKRQKKRKDWKLNDKHE
jgi:hypothetical protein